jgi:hypothetical protein
MENKKVVDDDGIKKHIAGILQKVLKERFPNEDFSNSMTIGQTPKIIGIRKNNFRRYIVLDSVSSSGLSKVKTTIVSTKECKIKSFSEHTKLLTVFFEGVLIQLGRTKLVAIYEQVRNLDGSKGFVKKEVRSIKEARDFITRTVEDTRVLLDDCLAHFCSHYGLKFNKIDWMRTEKGYFGDRFLDAVPSDTIFHSEKLRKVYAGEVEGLSGKDDDATVDTVLFYENRLKEDWFVKDILPVFVGRISAIEEKFGKSLEDLRSQALEPLTDQIKLHLRVQEATLKALQGLDEGIRRLSEDKPVELVRSGFSRELEGLRWKRIIP